MNFFHCLFYTVVDVGTSVGWMLHKQKFRFSATIHARNINRASRMVKTESFNSVNVCKKLQYIEIKNMS